jgi:isoleucyl-tRNA synthetase
VISTQSPLVKAMKKVDIEEFLVVSKWCACELSDSLGTFEIEGETFTVAKATKAKCPRCWKYHSENEESLCERCATVVA